MLRPICRQRLQLLLLILMILVVTAVGKMEWQNNYFERKAHHFPATSLLPPKKKQKADDKKWSFIRVITNEEPTVCHSKICDNKKKAPAAITVVSNLQARPTKKQQLSASVDATTGNSTRYSCVENHYNAALCVENHYNAALCSISKSLSLLTQLAGDPLEKNGVMLLRGNQQRHRRRRPHRRRNIGRALQLTMIIWPSYV